MYDHVFIDHPDLIAAVNEIGHEGMFQALCSEPNLAKWLEPFVEAGEKASFYPYTRDLILTACAETLSPCSGLENLSLALSTAFRTVGARTSEITKEFMDCSQYLLMKVGLALDMLDADGALSAKGLRKGDIDWKTLMMVEHRVRKEDPRSKAHDVSITLMKGNYDVYKLITVTLQPLVLKEIVADPDWLRGDHEPKLVHIRDWLETALLVQAPWLSNLNGDGVPKKLAKLRSVAAMAAEADKQMARALTRQPVARGPSAGEVMFAEDGGDYHLVRLSTPEALDRESGQMKHCVGLGSYDGYLSDPECVLLSLRDRWGRSHMTLEITRGVVRQFRGKANSVPKDEYLDAAKRLLAPHGFEWRSDNALGVLCVAALREMMGMGEPGVINVGGEAGGFAPMMFAEIRREADELG